VGVKAPTAVIRFETTAARDLTATFVGSQAVPAPTVASALSALIKGDGVTLLPATPGRSVLAISKPTLLNTIAPRTTLTAYARSRMKTKPVWLPINWFDNGRIEPIMAAPRFDRPMYEALDAYDRDWLVPGLGSINQTDFVTVLLTNPVFDETFLIGLSDQMGRELLWRNYPTDQRGTYFWRFWDADHDELGHPIHRFAFTALGTHMTASVGGAEGRVVLMVRGELLQRHPEAMVLAMRAGALDAKGHPEFIDPATDPSAQARVLFHAHLPPDITLVGFDLTAAQLKTERWWFVIAEHPTAPRFGLHLVPLVNGHPDPTQAAANTNKSLLKWNDLGALDFGRFLTATRRTLPIADPGGTPIAWAATSAMVAATLLQNPVRAAFDAKKLVGGLLT
jgi:hypothetical protein